MRPQTPLLIAVGLVGLFSSFHLAGEANAQDPMPRQYLGSHHDRVLDDAARNQRVLLSSIAAWLTTNFGLPETKELPVVAFVPQARMAALRYRGLQSRANSAIPAAVEEEAGSVVALYDPLRRAIYLSDGWRGETPVEVSVLVHEMVHHLQQMGRLPFECPQERERMAYAAQERWLALEGTSLAEAFDVDPFTVLALSTCLH